MNHFSSSLKFLFFLVLLAGMSSCFKVKVPVVGPPDDVTGDSTATPPVGGQSLRKVLIIGIDGCRGDAMRAANAPNIHGLLAHSIYSFDALTQAPTLSGPGWSSMLTGVWGNKHGVTDNSFAGNNFMQYPMVFKRLKQVNPLLHTISICSWDPINNNLITDADVKINTNENDMATKDSAVGRLKNDNPDVMFLHFDDVDHAGHQFGFDTTVSEYMQAISEVDGYVGEVLQALNNRPNVAKEDWLIIVSTDHGGNINGHGGDSYQEKNIFTVFYNKNFTPKEIVPPSSTLKAVRFPGAGYYAYTDSLYNFDDFSKFTVQFQIRTSGLESDPPFITNKDWHSGGNPGWVINVSGQSWKLNVGDGNGHRIDVNANAPDLDDNQWHYITVTFDRGGDASLYQDGKFYNYISMQTISTVNPAGADVKLALDEDITQSYGSDYGTANMSLANIKIFDTVLTADYIMNHQCDTTMDTDSPYYNNLLSWWKGTDGSGDILKDFSSRKLDLKLAGSPPWEQQQIDFCNMPLPPSVPIIVDIVPGILKWMNLNVDPGWGLDGRSWLP